MTSEDDTPQRGKSRLLIATDLGLCLLARYAIVSHGGRIMEPLAQETITTTQAKQVKAALAPGFRYVARLRARMEKTFKPTDPLFQATQRAYDAMHAMDVAWHYASCKSGVGMAEKE